MGDLRNLTILRFPLLLLGGISLIVGLWTGLSRLAWPTPPSLYPVVQHHGTLMVCVFFGAVIGLERFVAFPSLISLGAPLCALLGGGALVWGEPSFAFGLFSLSALFLTLTYVALIRRSFPDRWTKVWQDRLGLGLLTMAFGALCWGFGSGWAGYAREVSPEVVLFWMLFFLATIFGERLELSRVRGRIPWRRWEGVSFLAIFSLLVLAPVTALFSLQTFEWICGSLFMLVALWSLFYDAYRRGLHFPGLSRYMALLILSAYLWLLGGGIGLFWKDSTVDSVRHAFFLGFVFTMVFAHGPLMFPAILRVPFVFSSLFYLPWLILQVSLFLRVWGDIGGAFRELRWAGLMNGVAILLFLVCMVSHVLWGALRGEKAPPLLGGPSS